jgi:hypothetical protein
MDAFARFYGRNARLPGPLARGGAEDVLPGELAPPPGSLHSSGLVWAGGVDGYAQGSSQAPGPEVAKMDLTGIQAMRPAGEWAASSGADSWRSYWATHDSNSALAAVEGVATAPAFGSLFASTECLRYANGVCAMHGAAILPDSLMGDYDIGSVAPSLMGLGRVERCGCGVSKSKPLD